jgi:SAM-dependent methyltransferase
MPLFDVMHAVSKIRNKFRRVLQKQRDRSRSAREVFSEVYTMNLWGGAKGELYSGPGSRFTAAKLYSATVIKFIEDHKIKTVVDLGCGDFEIGKNIALHCDKYIGIDVAPNVIARNTQLFATESIRFVEVDITREDLPDADLCLVRQVFQHMSNREILQVLLKARKYKYLIVTEHQPNDPLKLNRDKVHGAGTRVDFRSGVYLDKPPFSVKGLDLLIEASVEVANDDGQPVKISDWGVIRTFQVFV